ncbi:hypothetical protein AHMF7605_28920 [Adhaeribacter arboris]|uniref:Bacterial mobilisation domain-containing protein n=1 Tax=Adhaeribacter arboris TaxID=2072846 RepID=A0A2T2Y8U9_9BACT|nr:plasmid mobilization relaxosome protein MobC [Adhaeribacter arboris]PSR51934.1 hypothetical protein AHMF7605_28920 [Adhaeribacter arboris]
MEEEIKNWNPKGGRPKKSDKERRDKPVLIKFTEDERNQLYKESEDLGWKQPLVYFRNKLLSKTNSTNHNPQSLFKALNRLNPELNKVGNNINQIARYVNYLDKNNMVDQKFIAEYSTCFKEMIEVQKEYTLAIKAYLRSVSKK